MEIKKSEQVVELEQMVPAIQQNAQEIQVLNEADLPQANAFLIEVTKQLKTIEGERKKLVNPLNETKNRIQDLFKKLAGPFETAQRLVKGKVQVFLEEEEKKRLEVERKLQEKARLEEERRRKELEARAEKWDAKGNEEKAQILREEADQHFVPTPMVEQVQRTTKSEMGSMTGKTDLEIIVHDPKAFIKAVADGLPLVNAIRIQESVIKSFVKATGTERIPGVEIRKKKVISVRTA